MRIREYTTINHKAQQKLGLTLTEYCLADLVYHLGNNPKRTGWCDASKAYLADAIGVTERGIFKMLTKLEEDGLITRGESRLIRTTEKWYEEAVAKDPAMNKVHRKHEQSSVKTMNKVHTTTRPNSKTTASPKGEEPRLDKRDPEIQFVMDHFEKLWGFEIRKPVLGRWPAKRLIAKHGVEKVVQLLEYARSLWGEQYKPQVNNLKDLEEKVPNLISAWQQEQNEGKKKPMKVGRVA